MTQLKGTGVSLGALFYKLGGSLQWIKDYNKLQKTLKI